MMNDSQHLFTIAIRKLIPWPVVHPDGPDHRSDDVDYIYGAIAYLLIHNTILCVCVCVSLCVCVCVCVCVRGGWHSSKV